MPTGWSAASTRGSQLTRCRRLYVAVTASISMTCAHGPSQTASPQARWTVCVTTRPRHSPGTGSATRATGTFAPASCRCGRWRHAIVSAAHYVALRVGGRGPLIRRLGWRRGVLTSPWPSHPDRRHGFLPCFEFAEPNTASAQVDEVADCRQPTNLYPCPDSRGHAQGRTHARPWSHRRNLGLSLDAW